jgi:hypothetical protein
MRRGGRWLTARLMYAGRDRSSAIRRKVPWTKSAHGIGHSLNGDQFCGGGAPAHGGVLARAQQVPGASSKIVHSGLGGHFGPHEPGQLSGDGGDDDVAVGFALVETTEPAA